MTSACVIEIKADSCLEFAHNFTTVDIVRDIDGQARHPLSEKEQIFFPEQFISPSARIPPCYIDSGLHKCLYLISYLFLSRLIPIHQIHFGIRPIDIRVTAAQYGLYSVQTLPDFLLHRINSPRYDHLHLNLNIKICASILNFLRY